MTNDCKTCPVSTGTHKPAEAMHQIAEPSSQTPEDAQIQALMRKHRIWIEHSTLFENDEPERELRAVQAEEHQFNAFVQDLIAATQLAAAPQAVQPAVPDGWKLVPMEPQDMQQVAGAQAIRFDTTVINKMWTANKVYREMVAAAPAHPAEGVPAQTVPEIDERAAFDDFFRKRNRLHPDTDTTFRSDAAEPWKYWKARAAIAATQPAAQGLDSSGLMDAVRVYLDAQDALDNREYHGIHAEPYEKVIARRNYAREDLDAALAAQAKQGGA